MPNNNESGSTKTKKIHDLVRISVQTAQEFSKTYQNWISQVQFQGSGILVVVQLVQQDFPTSVSDGQEPAAWTEIQAPRIVKAEPRPWPVLEHAEGWDVHESHPIPLLS